VWSLAETREQENEVENLLVRCISVTTIIAHIRKKYGAGKTRTDRLIERVKSRWLDEDSGVRPFRKAAQARRLTRWIELASGRLNPADPTQWLEKPNLVSLATFERLYAELHGTLEPIKHEVDVRVSETILHVIASLRPEDMHRILSEYQETVALANHAREHLPQLTNGVTHAAE
jgi:hypothetical protein